MPEEPEDFPLSLSTGNYRINQLLTESEMARELGCCGRTVRRLRYQGIIPILRVGRLVRYNAGEVVRALREHSGQKGPAENQ